MKNQVKPTNNMKTNLNQLDGAVAAKNNTPQDKMNKEIDLYKANLMELLIPAYRESVGLSSLFRSPEHETVQMLCGLLKNGFATEVLEALSPIARLIDKLTQRNELIDEISEVVQSNFTESHCEDGSVEKMSISDCAILQVELIGTLLIDNEALITV